MLVDGILPIGQRQGDVVIHSLTTNIGHVHALFISFFEGRIFSHWILMKIICASGTLHCRKTHIPCGDQLEICALYVIRRYEGVKEQPDSNADHKIDNTPYKPWITVTNF
jgi:hypothetical protein